MEDSLARDPMRLSELLRELRCGPIQCAGCMHVVPLLGARPSPETASYASPFDDCADPARVEVITPLSLTCVGAARMARGALPDARPRPDPYDLEQLVATFECVVDQLGAVVLIGGEVVGLEIGPSDAFWELTWPVLVREVYGPMAVSESEREPDRRFARSSRGHPRSRGQAKDALESDGGASLEAFGRAVAAIERADDEAVLARVVDFRQAILTTVRVPGGGHPERAYVRRAGAGPRCFGEVVREGPRLVAVSIVADAMVSRIGSRPP